MLEQLNQSLKNVNLVPIQTVTETTTGSGVDTYLSSKPAFDSALILAEIGNLGDQASTTVKIEESDASDFGSGVSVAKGGAEVTVAADNSYQFQVERTKRYLRAVVTITGGSAPSAEVFVGGILWNAQRPFPIL